MKLSTPEIQRLANLQGIVQEHKNEINYIIDIMEQLAFDRCSIFLEFKIHNKTTCDASKSREIVDRLLEDAIEANVKQVGAGNFLRTAPKRDPQSCHNHVSHIIGEASGMVILDAILKEKRKAYDAANEELKKLLQKAYPQTAFYPTQFLHHETV